MSNSIADEAFIFKAKEEIKDKIQDELLWRKAIALMDANIEEVEKKYIKLRVLHLKKGGVAIPSKEELIIPKKKVKIEKKIEPNKKNFKSNSSSMGVGLLIITSIIILFAYFLFENNFFSMSSNTANIKKTKKIVNDGKYSLNIHPTPAKANVSIVNIKQKYHKNIRLEEGKYNIKISSSGYTSKSLWIDLNKDTVENINLNRIGNTFSLIVATSPRGSKIKVLNINQKFKQGMLLKKGSYHIEVSRYNFETKKQWIDLNKDTQLNITLNKKAFTTNTLSYDELKWCMKEQDNLDTLKRKLNTLSYSLDKYSQSAIDNYNKKVNKSNKRNKFWNTRCQNKKYKQGDYNKLKY